MVLCNMSVRKCIYTGKDSRFKDKVLPNPVLDEEIHNWDNYAPISPEYKELKKDSLPTELEMEIHETFKLLELAKLRVKFYEIKLDKLQQKNNKTIPKLQKNTEKHTQSTKKAEKQQTKKDNEIKLAQKTKELTENMDKNINQLLKDRKKLWE